MISTYIQISSITRETKVLTIEDSFIVEIGSHVMCNWHDKVTQVIKVALCSAIGILVKVKLDHVAIVAIVRNSEEE